MKTSLNILNTIVVTVVIAFSAQAQKSYTKRINESDSKTDRKLTTRDHRVNTQGSIYHPDSIKVSSVSFTGNNRRYGVPRTNRQDKSRTVDHRGTGSITTMESRKGKRNPTTGKKIEVASKNVVKVKNPLRSSNEGPTDEEIAEFLIKVMDRMEKRRQ